MIRASIGRDAPDFGKNALRLAKAHAEARRRRALRDGSHWRQSELLWPAFGRED
ncbi:MAG: hypothetical protein WA908_01745 [Pontixanthobacter sp.]